MFVCVCVYIYIYTHKMTPPKKKTKNKNRTHIFLTEMHKFNSSLFFFSGYEVESEHEKLGP